MGASLLASWYAVQKKYVCEHHNNYFSGPELSLFVD